MSELSRYKLKPGVGKHTLHGAIYRAGDTIRLTAVQAERIKDKLETSAAKEARAPEPPQSPRTPVELPTAPEDVQVAEAEKPKEAAGPSKFLIQSTEGGFNVRSRETLALLNDGPLSQEDAEALVAAQ